VLVVQVAVVLVGLVQAVGAAVVIPLVAVRV